MGGIFREELRVVNAEGDEVTVWCDWAEVPAEETVDDEGERAGEKMEVCDPLLDWVLRCEVCTAGKDSRDSVWTGTTIQAESLGEGVRGAGKNRNQGGWTKGAAYSAYQNPQTDF